MRTTHRLMAAAGALALVMVLGSLPTTVRANTQDKRNGAIALGTAAAILLATQRDKTAGLVAAGAAAYTYAQYENERRRYRDRWDGDRWRDRDCDRRWDRDRDRWQRECRDRDHDRWQRERWDRDRGCGR